MVGLGGGREVVGIIRPHFVEIGVYFGQPLVVERDALAGFLLSLPGPVAVQVEVVVVEAAAGPGLVVLPGVGLGVGRLVTDAVVPVGVPVMAVGVHARVHDNDGIFEPVLHLLVLRVGQVIEHLHHGFGAHGFVAVHVVAQPAHGRLLPLAGAGFQPGQLEVVMAHVVEAAEGLGAGNLHHFQRAVFVGAAVAHQLHAAGRVSRDVSHVAQQLGVGRELSAQLITQKLAGGKERAGSLGGLGLAGKRQHQKQQQPVFPNLKSASRGWLGGT